MNNLERPIPTETKGKYLSTNTRLVVAEFHKYPELPGCNVSGLPSPAPAQLVLDRFQPGVASLERREGSQTVLKQITTELHLPVSGIHIVFCIEPEQDTRNGHI